MAGGGRRQDGHTAPGIEEATAAGSWAVGVAMSGNAVRLSPEELAGLDPAATARLRERAAAELRAAAAHHVIDTVADLLPVVEAIDARLAAGDTPPSQKDVLKRTSPD